MAGGRRDPHAAEVRTIGPLAVDEPERHAHRPPVIGHEHHVAAGFGDRVRHLRPVRVRLGADLVVGVGEGVGGIRQRAETQRPEQGGLVGPEPADDHGAGRLTG
jgi:hypothetical protein